MNLAEINEEMIELWQRETASVERQQQQLLLNYTAAVRALCASAKSYINARDELERGDAPGTEPKTPKKPANGSGKLFQPTSRQKPDDSLPRSQNGSASTDLAIPAQAEVKQEEIEISKRAFEELSLSQALFKYFLICRVKKNTIAITFDLRRGGFISNNIDFISSLNSMLRYYERKKIFERDVFDRWGLTRQYANEDALNLLSGKNAHSISNRKSTAEYCLEILENSEKRSLHVDEFVRILNEKYELNITRDVVASALRRNAKNKRFFRALGKNRFGLLKEAKVKVTDKLRQIPQA